MQVRAITPGFYGSYRIVGEVFDVPNSAKATWFVPVKQAGGQAPQPGAPASNAGQGLV